jgi:polyribonucleotide nucleotidyltransferase
MQTVQHILIIDLRCACCPFHAAVRFTDAYFETRSVQVPEQRIGCLIGPGGCVVKEIQEKTHSSINLAKGASKKPGFKEVKVTAMTSEAITAACDLIQKVRMPNATVMSAAVLRLECLYSSHYGGAVPCSLQMHTMRC